MVSPSSIGRRPPAASEDHPRIVCPARSVPVECSGREVDGYAEVERGTVVASAYNDNRGSTPPARTPGLADRRRRQEMKRAMILIAALAVTTCLLAAAPAQAQV